MEKTFVTSDLLKAAQDTIDPKNTGLSVEMLCEKAFGLDENGEPNKSQFTLYREVNPNDKGAKLGLVDAARLMNAGGVFTVLHVLAAMTEHRITKAIGIPDGKDANEEALQGFSAVHRFVEAFLADAPYWELSELLAAAVKELEDCFVRARNRDMSAKQKEVNEQAVRQ